MLRTPKSRNIPLRRDFTLVHLLKSIVLFILFIFSADGVSDAASLMKIQPSGNLYSNGLYLLLLRKITDSIDLNGVKIDGIVDFESSTDVQI